MNKKNKIDYSNLDDLEIKNIDAKRIKKLDRTKKISAIESVFDERTFSLLNKLLTNGILNDFYGFQRVKKQTSIWQMIMKTVM